MEKLIQIIRKLKERQNIQKMRSHELHQAYLSHLTGTCVNSRARKAYKRYDDHLNNISRDIDAPLRAAESALIDMIHGDVDSSVPVASSALYTESKVYMKDDAIKMLLDTMMGITPIVFYETLVRDGYVFESMSYPTIKFAVSIEDAKKEFEKCFSYNYKKML